MPIAQVPKERRASMCARKFGRHNCHQRNASSSNSGGSSRGRGRTRLPRLGAIGEDDAASCESAAGGGAKHRQNRIVSSPAAETTVSPLGDAARWSTRELCPVRSATLVNEGYFQMVSWLSLYPCEVTISVPSRFHTAPHTCDRVSTELISSPARTSQNLSVLSAVPPPEARTPDCTGFQASAFTAALCCVATSVGEHSRDWRLKSQTLRRLSLPPDASCVPFGDHLRPHTSCVWPWYTPMQFGRRTS
mmetsp:Transcript_54051/g.166291  ORF Transcript_54051/g.166291 Transcript_54051/m.166291 type:complete len:248 (-) Transcript_54051:637-1380(-)